MRPASIIMVLNFPIESVYILHYEGFKNTCGRICNQVDERIHQIVEM